MNTDNYTYRAGITPNTRAVLSSKVRIFAPASGTEGLGGQGGNLFLQVGLISSFSHTDSRGVNPIRGIGFGDQIAELVPDPSDPISLSVERTALYLANVMQSFGYNAGVDGFVRALKDHAWPFDIRHEVIFSAIAVGDKHILKHALKTKNTTHEPTGKQCGECEAVNNEAIVTIYQGCWMNSYGISFTSDTTLVAESVDITVTDIFDLDFSRDECACTGNEFSSTLFGRSRGHTSAQRSGYDNFKGGSIPITSNLNYIY